MTRPSHFTATTALVLALLVAGCSGTGGFSSSQVRRHFGKLLVPPQTELQLGQRVAQQIEQKEGVTRDAGIASYVQQIGNRLAQHARSDRGDVRFQFKVLDKPGTVNAVAVPGGFIYIYSGLIAAADNEAELAGVIAHEIGHVVGRHSANQMATQLGMQKVAQIALGKQEGQLVQIAAQFAAKGAMAKFSRDDEREADAYAVKYMRRAGYDPSGLKTFFEELLAMEKRSPSVVEAILSTHPTTRERIRNIDAQVRRTGGAGGEVGREHFLRRTASLRRGR